MFETAFIVGPTCAGKSGLAAGFARFVFAKKNISCEVVSCDSMQIYRYMDIGTAKPSKDEQKIVPYHMIDVVDITGEYNVAKFVSDAQKSISEIKERNHLPLVVGGTGMYFRALADGLFDGPTADLKIRERLEGEAEKNGVSFLFAKLGEVDKISAAKIEPTDKRRIIRALEVYYSSGRPISEYQTQWGKKKDVKVIGITRERADLYDRINERVDEMFKNGLVDEVKRLEELGLRSNKTAGQALGYKELLEYLDGKCGLEEAKELIKTHTRQYAKRQLTWFRRDERVKWIEIKKSENEESVVKRIYEQFSRYNHKTAI